MNSEENNKKEEIKKQAWQTPEIIDLDVDRTEAGITTSHVEATLPAASAS